MGQLTPRRARAVLEHGARWLAINLGLFALAVAIAVAAYGAATPSELSVHAVVVNTLGYTAILLPFWIAYLLLLRVLRSRPAAVLLSPLAFLVLFPLAAGDDTPAWKIALTVGLPALAYGLVVRLPRSSARAPGRLGRRGTPPGTRPAA